MVVPFGAGAHDWAALRLGAWVARATDAPLRLIGSAADGGEEARDASRLLADASLIVQRTAGIVAEPLLASPGREGVAALAEGAALLVVGLSERWREEGLGHVRGELAMAPPAPTVFVRRGRRPDGLAPAETRTPFSWSLTGQRASRTPFTGVYPGPTRAATGVADADPRIRPHGAAGSEGGDMLRRSHILTTAALLAVCATPASAATYEDLRSPDAVDAAEHRGPYEADRGPYTLNRDYGSPDAADAARDVPSVPAATASGPGPYTDSERRLVESPEVQQIVQRIVGEIRAATPVVEVRGPSGGFDWADAGIGAAGMLALLSIAAGSALMLTVRRRRRSFGVAAH